MFTRQNTELREHMSLCCSVVIMLYCYCVALLLFVLSYVLIVCTVPLPPGVNPIAVDKYRVSQEECEILRESVPYVKLYRYNPKHLYPKLNGYGDNGQRNLKL